PINGVTIIYQFQHLILIQNKPALPTIPPKTKRDRRVKSAYSLLTDYMHTEKRANIKSGEGDYKASSRVFVVHRLDRDTSGLLLFAKDEYTKQLMQSKWNEMVLERKYIAVLEGRPDKDSGRIESWLSENEKSLKVSSSPVPVEGGQHAVSYFKVLEARKRCCVVEFELETGRKNQIRVHASKVLGKPIIGDKKYDAVSGFKGRIALHAKTLVFRNPYGGMTMSFESPVPVEFDYLK
ncbi:MAG: RNA pseudouridine synthase, partial [Bacteroidales bacterium]|nr:RNA pseudouridine synthase [Bacteroidales bacterium]